MQVTVAGMMVLAMGEILRVCRVSQDGMVVLSDDTGSRVVFVDRSQVEFVERRLVAR